VIEGLLLVLVGVGLVVGLFLAFRSADVRDRLYRSDLRLRERVRVQPAEPEAFVRHFEMAIYGGMCLGGVLALLGVLVAAG